MKRYSKCYLAGRKCFLQDSMVSLVVSCTMISIRVYPIEILARNVLIAFFLPVLIRVLLVRLFAGDRKKGFEEGYLSFLSPKK